MPAVVNQAHHHVVGVTQLIHQIAKKRGLQCGHHHVAQLAVVQHGARHIDRPSVVGRQVGARDEHARDVVVDGLCNFLKIGPVRVVVSHQCWDGGELYQAVAVEHGKAACSGQHVQHALQVLGRMLLAVWVLSPHRQTGQQHVEGVAGGLDLHFQYPGRHLALREQLRGFVGHNRVAFRITQQVQARAQPQPQQCPQQPRPAISPTSGVNLRGQNVVGGVVHGGMGASGVSGPSCLSGP